MVDWEFSYIDVNGNFRGAFFAKEMQVWYERGYLCKDLQIFVHRGLIADRITLSELCKRNGEKTPFKFSSPPENVVVYEGFNEFPPGITIKPEKIASKTSLTKDTGVLPGTINAGRDGITEMKISSNEAQLAKSWPLLSPPDKNFPQTKRRTWITQQFSSLRYLFSNADLSKLNVENQDLYAAVCKFCNVRLATATDVFRHLSDLNHQQLVKLKCQISGKEFDDYRRRLQNVVKPRTVTSSTGNLSASSVASTSKTALSTDASSSTTASVDASNSGKTPLSGTASKGPDASVTTVRTFTNSQKTGKQSANAPANAKTGTKLATSSSSLPKLLQPATDPSSRILTDKEFNEEMQSLRLIARKINTQKFMQLYKDRMPSKCCQLCNVKSEGPTTFLAHYTSKDHCNRARNNGFKATEADIALWRSQILASM